MKSNYFDLGLFINGRLQTQGRATQPVINPRNEEVIGKLPIATLADVDAAVDAAHEAFEQWRDMSAKQRSQILSHAVDYIQANKEQLANIISLEQGKPVNAAYGEIKRACEHFQWAAEETKRLYGRVIPSRSKNGFDYIYAEPIGPVAAITGWNAPAVTPSRKLSGVLAAGCPIILKPSEDTPATALFLVQALHYAGIPAGAVNVLFGEPRPLVSALLDSSAVKGLTFTGGTAIGKELAGRAAASLKRMVLELGGHAPAIVFADADVESAARKLAAAKFVNAGQICTSPTRFLVHESVYKRFKRHFLDYVHSLRLSEEQRGDGPVIGPLTNLRRLQAVQGFVDDAVEKGAKVLAGGSSVGQQGFYYEPTVLEEYGPSWKAANEEPFGPVALLRPFATEQEALQEANRLPYGLAAYIFTNNARLIHEATRRIESGVVCVNHCVHSVAEAPFGGYRDSGYGKEGGIEGLKEFLRYKSISQVT